MIGPVYSDRSLLGKALICSSSYLLARAPCHLTSQQWQREQGHKLHNQEVMIKGPLGLLPSKVVIGGNPCRRDCGRAGHPKIGPPGKGNSHFR